MAGDVTGCTCEHLAARVKDLEGQLLAAQSTLAEQGEALRESQEALAAAFSRAEAHENLSASHRDKLAEALLDVQRRNQDLDTLRAGLDIMETPIIAVDRHGFVVEWNRKAAECLGCDRVKALHRRFSDFMHKDQRTAFEATVGLALDRLFGAIGESSWDLRTRTSSVGNGWEVLTDVESSDNAGYFQYTFHPRSRNGDGAWQRFSLRASPWIAVSGREQRQQERDSGASALAMPPGGLVYTLQDVTAGGGKTWTETDLVAEDLTRLVRTVNAAIIGVDQSGSVNEWNRQAELLTGYSKADAFGRDLVQNFISEEFADPVQAMVSQCLMGQEKAFEFSLFTKSGQRREVLLSATARRNRHGAVVGVICVGQDITELRSESKMLANYVKICGAAVWSLRGNAMTGAVIQCMTKEIEQLISQQAQMDVCDPRMVLWRASFVSILKTMCQTFWVRRKEARESGSGDLTMGGAGGDASPSGGLVTPSTNFNYEFCFEAPNGQVKWYKVEGHLMEEDSTQREFEVTGSMQEVTSMWIDKAMGDRWQKWWSRMCHMVFDATLLVDTQEYRVLNAWGEEKIFGCQVQPNHPLLHLIKPADAVALKEAFNEVTFRGFERGRTLHLLRPGDSKEMPAQCFLLSADQENPNECMMGIRMQDAAPARSDTAALWDVSRPNRVLTLEDLARLRSGLKRHRRVSDIRHKHRSGERRSVGPSGAGVVASSKSLSSIPEDLHGESEDEDDLRSVCGVASIATDNESSKSSNGSDCSSSSQRSKKSTSEVGVCNSKTHGSDSLGPDEVPSGLQGLLAETRIRSPPMRPQMRPPPVYVAMKKTQKVRVGPPTVKLKRGGKTFDINLDDYDSVTALRVDIQEKTGIPPLRQTLILNGRRLPYGDNEEGAGETSWEEMKKAVRPGQPLMLIGSAPSNPGRGPGAAAATSDDSNESPAAEGAPLVEQERQDAIQEEDLAND